LSVVPRDAGHRVEPLTQEQLALILTQRLSPCRVHLVTPSGCGGTPLETKKEALPAPKTRRLSEVSLACVAYWPPRGRLVKSHAGVIVLLGLRWKTVLVLQF
jgi:hypothetical protein